ncbi:bZIP domain-containing protein [Phanerochaete sordida]|uniref:BZIP domain-containing protein n=1 Tax=Phanerochaete sordida TaxID=48140 RepID=A0A9P3GG57_9APHY|nr:bZIP domain-containing protein [Phanerochaete sordida]
MMADFAQPPTFEDFFNFDMFAGPSTGPGTSSSRSSSSSPSQSYAALPQTPPTAFEMAFNPDSQFFTDPYLEDDFTKLEPQAVAPMSTTSHGFMSDFPPIFEESSSDSSGDSPGTIDPQLVETPATSSRSEFGDEEEEHEEEEAAMAEDDGIAVPKVGGKGKLRKGTVTSGGVSKKILAPEKRDKTPSPAMLSTTTMDPDDWRPTPEEYKRMSSKEKRQLRNKISARNFRVRRKEYISTLEGDIAERDRLLDAIRTELRSTSDENKALRQEIDALKRALLDGRGRADTPVLPPPAPLPPISAAAALAGSGLKSPPPTPSPVPKSPMLTPNVHKDLPMSPRLAGRNFWGGNLGLGGIAPVHTTLVPDLSSVLSGKPPTAQRSSGLQENINPQLNGQMQPEKTMEISMPMTPFDSFTEMNPFTMKTLDAYRMHLWTRMAQQQAHMRAANGQPSTDSSRSPSPQQLSGLATNLRPHYFAKSSSVLSSVLSGKSATNAYPSPPSSPPTVHATLPGQLPGKQQVTPSQQQAMLASMASQTLLGKLGSAFWDAFSGGSPSTSKLDTDKVRKVLEGKAVLRVVDVDAPHVPAQQAATTAPSERIVTPSPRPARMASPVPKYESGPSLEKIFGKLHI